MSTKRILIFSATEGYRHDSIPTAIEALRKLESDLGVHFEATEDEVVFRDESLAKFDAVLFLSNMGEVISEEGMTALQKYFDRGGDFIGIHSASCAMPNHDFFVKHVGATFDYHPDFCHATLDVVDRSHPSTKKLPERWAIEDEIYNFKSDPRDVGVTVLLTVDESTYDDPGPRKYDHGSPHPIAWYQTKGAGASSSATAGRSWYTSLGHSHETWKDELFLAHVSGGIRWAVGLE